MGFGRRNFLALFSAQLTTRIFRELSIKTDVEFCCSRVIEIFIAVIWRYYIYDLYDWVCVLL